MPTYSYKGYDFEVNHIPTEAEFQQMSAYVDSLPPKESLVDKIPGIGPKLPEQPEPSLIDQTMGLAAGGISTLSGLTTGGLGMAAGAVEGIAKDIMSGNIGTPKAEAEKIAMQRADQLTWTPKSEAGQQGAERIGKVMEAALPAIIPLAPQLEALSHARSMQKTTKPVPTVQQKDIVDTAVEQPNIDKMFSSIIDTNMADVEQAKKVLMDIDMVGEHTPETLAERSAWEYKLDKYLNQRAQIEARTKYNTDSPEVIQALLEKYKEEATLERTKALEEANKPKEFPKNESQEKPTPVETALVKINEAMKETKEEVVARIDAAQEKLDNIGDNQSRSATREALVQEIKAYEDIVEGKQPNVELFEGKGEAEPAKNVPKDVPVEPKPYDEHSASIEAMIRAEQEKTQVPLEADIADIAANKAVRMDIMQRAGEYLDSGATPIDVPTPINRESQYTAQGWLKMSAGKMAMLDNVLKKTIETINMYKDGITPSGTIDIAALEKKRYALERAIERMENTRQSIIESNKKPFEVDVPVVEEITIHPVEVKYSDVQSVLNEWPGNVGNVVDLLENNKHLVDKIGEAYFDKAFDNTTFGKTTKKILTHFLEVTGLNKDKVYFVLDNTLNNAYGDTRWSGNTTVIRLNPEKMGKPTEVLKGWQSIVTDTLKGANLTKALDTFMAVRVGAHEIGHMLLIKYAKTHVTNPTEFFNISRRFEDFMKKEKFENVSITDFSRGGAKSYRERQAMFHEFFAEETTRVLMNKHLLGAFSKGVSKTFSHLIEASRKQLTNAGMKVDRTTFASDIVNSILDGNKESIKKYGKTIFEKIELDNNNKLVAGSEPLFKNNTLEEVRQQVGSRGWETKPDIKTVGEDMFAGLALSDAPTISARAAHLLGTGAVKLASKFFNKANLQEMYGRLPEVHSAYQAIRGAEERATRIVNDLWYKTPDALKLNQINVFGTLTKIKAADSPYIALSKATNKDMRALLDVFQKGFESELDYADNLAKNGSHLTKEQTAYYNTLSELFTKMYQHSVDLQQRLNKKHELPYRKGWFPSVRTGRYSVTVGFGDIMAHRQHFTTKLQAEKFIEKMKQHDLKGLEVSEVLDSTAEPMQTNQHMADIISDFLSRNGYKQAPELIQRVVDSMNERGGKVGRHHEYRQGISGYKGTELFKSLDEQGKSFREAIEQSITEKGNQLKTLEINTKVRPILDNPEFKKDNPNSHAVIQQMYDSTLGRNQDWLDKPASMLDYTINKATDSVLNVLGKELTKDSSVTRDIHEAVKTAFYFTKMVPSVAFSVIGQYLTILPGTVSRASYGGHGLMAYKSFAKAMMKLATGDGELFTAIKNDAQLYNSFEASFVESMDMRKGDNPVTSFIKDWVLLQAPARASDTMSRVLSYAVMYTHFRDLGHNFAKARQMARYEADIIMNLYDKANSAPIFDHMGMAGDFIKPLQGFGQNMLGNLINSVRHLEARDFRTWGPFVNYVVLTTAMSGVISLPFIQEYEMLRKMLADKFDDVSLPPILDIFANDDYFLQRTVPMTEEQRQALMLGIPALSKIDLAKSNRANQTFFTLLAGVLTGNENLMKAMPMVEWGMSVPGDLITSAQAMLGKTTVAEGKKAMENAMPVGAIGYGMKELAGLNTTRIGGQQTDMIPVGKEGQANVKRDAMDVTAGLLGTRSTNQKWTEMRTMEDALQEKTLQAKRDSAAIKFTETGDEKYLKKMLDLGMDGKSIQNKVGTEVFNRLVTQDMRQMINKQGKLISGKGERKAQRLFKFGE